MMVIILKNNKDDIKYLSSLSLVYYTENTMENNTITAAPRTRTMAEHLQLMTENIVSQQETQVADTGRWCGCSLNSSG